MGIHREFRHDIVQAADLLRAGGLVAFPTETVYGLGADAACQRAVSRIFAAKGRPADHPLIVHLGQMADLDLWARDIPAEAWHLATHFWPGPLTLILKRRPDVLDLVTGGQDTIGVRMPDHPLALALLKTFGGAIAAPSANRFGRISPTAAAHVIAELGIAVDYVIDGGPCAVGLESTILDLSGVQPRVLRPGAVTCSMLAEWFDEIPITGDAGGPRAPGRLPSHYAPSTPLRLLESAAIDESVLSTLITGQFVTVLSMRPPKTSVSGYRWETMPTDPQAYARVFYTCLRNADRKDCRCILVELPPATEEWTAVNDRLKRAAANTQQNKLEVV